MNFCDCCEQSVKDARFYEAANGWDDVLLCDSCAEALDAIEAS